MLWTGAVVAMIDGVLRRAAAFWLVAALFTLFGVIHSVIPSGGIYVPWQLEGLAATICWQFTGAYLALAALMGVLALQRRPTP